MSLSTENQENYLLKVENLKKHFPISDGLFSKSSQTVKAVDGVNLHVSTGETLGIVGESGCGKSTFGGMVLSLLEPTEGKIFFEGKDISELPKKDIKEMK